MIYPLLKLWASSRGEYIVKYLTKNACKLLKILIASSISGLTFARGKHSRPAARILVRCIQDTLSSRARLASESREQMYLAYKLVRDNRAYCIQGDNMRGRRIHHSNKYEFLVDRLILVCIPIIKYCI